MAATVEKLRHTHGNSATMKNMLHRLRELKKKVKKEPKVEKREPVEYHGANETIVQEAKEERAMKGAVDSTIQMKYFLTLWI